LTATTSAQPSKKSHRPSMGRLIASWYVDLLICGFVSWVVCYAFGWQSTWVTLAISILAGERLWCRDQLTPTAGQYCLGIRYLMSSSSQVVADIKVINQKLKLNGFLLAAGVVDLTFAILFLCGWTFMTKAVVWGFSIEPPLSLLYWIAIGLLFFLSSGNLLSGSKPALWAVPLVHIATGVEFFRSYPTWRDLLQNEAFSPPWVTEALIHMAKYQSFFILELYALWSLFVIASVFLSRKHLVN
jgi:hypothetical protein